VPTLPVPEEPVRRQGIALPTLEGLANWGRFWEENMKFWGKIMDKSWRKHG
jgi:hypothetical protein